jgi:predicted transcriptional regulator
VEFVVTPRNPCASTIKAESLGKILSERVFPMLPELELEEPRALHALAHPIRMALIDHLRDRDVATASECAAAVGQSVQSCSYHLRALARWGVLEEVPATDGRRRPWRLRVSGINVSKRRMNEPEFRTAWAQLRARVIERDLAALNDFLAAEPAYEPEWRDTASFLNQTLYLTPAEAGELSAKLTEVLQPYIRDNVVERPQGAGRVHAVLWLLPRAR